MDWTQTKNVAEASLDTIVGKASNPRVALEALEKKITAEVDKVEAHLTALDARVNELPGLLDAADKLVLKVDAVVQKAKADGRADLVAAANGRKQKQLAERATLEKELESIDGAMTEADEWLTKLQDKLVEVQARIDKTPANAGPVKEAVAAAAAAVPAAVAKAAVPAAAPAAPAKTSPVKAAPAKAAPVKAGQKDALDDEFAALLGELNVDLAKVELPKKKNAPAKLPDSDDGIPELVTVADNELPEGEELPPLKQPKGAAASAKAAPAPAAKAAAPAAKAAPAPAAKAPVPAQADSEPAKKSKAWLWVTSAVVVVGGGGAAVAHFVLGWF